MEKEFEESFENCYSQIQADCLNETKEAKKKLYRYLGGIFALFVCIAGFLFLFNICEPPIVLLVFALEMAAMLYLVISGRQIYKNKYKQIVINELLKGYNEKLSFNYKMGMSSSDYKMSEFDKKYDKYYSEDRISGSLSTGDRCQFSEIAIIDVIKNKVDGNVKETNVERYRGLFGMIQLTKKIRANISVLNDERSQRFSKERIEVDSSEFEKYYDLIAEDKIFALRIFTSDVIEKLNEIRRINDNKYPFEIKIRDNTIYYRYKCGEMFEPPAFFDDLSKERLKKYYKIIYYSTEIIETIVKSINEIADVE